jgi:hypothetical protein
MKLTEDHRLPGEGGPAFAVRTLGSGVPGSGCLCRCPSGRAARGESRVGGEV